MRPNRLNGKSISCNEPMPEEVRSESKQYAIEIYQVDNGFVVNVGCKTLIFKTLNELQDAIKLYYTDIEEAKKRYLK